MRAIPLTFRETYLARTSNIQCYGITLIYSTPTLATLGLQHRLKYASAMESCEHIARSTEINGLFTRYPRPGI